MSRFVLGNRNSSAGLLRTRKFACVIAGIAVCLLLACGCGGGPSAPEDIPAAGIATDQGEGIAPDPAQLECILKAELAQLGIDPAKETSSAPSGLANRIADLQVQLVDPDGDGPLPPTAVELSWTDVLSGDYNNNGVVGVEDITPLGQYWASVVEYDPPELHNGFMYRPTGDRDGEGALNWRLARIDGNRNGLIELGDISTIGQHWQERLDGYRVYRKAPGETEFTPLMDGEQPLLLSRELPAGDPLHVPLRYTIQDVLGEPGDYEYMVAAYNSQDDSEGPMSCGVCSGFSSPPPSLLLVRDDNHVYDANYDAVTDDLDTLGELYTEVDYYAGIPTDYPPAHFPQVIWYRGGPGADSEPQEYTTEWTTDEIDDYLHFMRRGQDLLLLSQSHGVHEPPDTSTSRAWIDYFGWDILAGSIPVGDDRHPWATGFTLESSSAPVPDYGYLRMGPRNVMVDSELSGKWPRESRSVNDYDDDYVGAEGFSGSGSSGNIPVIFDLADNRQICGMGTDYFDQGGRFAPAARPGISTIPEFIVDGDKYDVAFVSWGCLGFAPYEDIGYWPPPYDWNSHGSSYLWVIGYSWGEMSVTEAENGNMTRAEVLQNTLAWIRQ